MKHDHTFAEAQQLAPVYFSPPKAWWFHTSDFFIFYYILSAIISIIVLVILLAGFSGGSSESAAPVQQPAVVASPETEPADTEVLMTDPSPEANASTDPLETASPDQAALLKSAQEQPTYALQIEAYRQLQNNATLNAAQRDEVGRALRQAETELQRWEKNLTLAKRYMEQEYYSSAIKALTPFLEKGNVLGNLLPEAQAIYQKAHTKKIDYFLLKGQLTQAKKALQEAESGNLPESLTRDYAEKIKNLELAGR